MTSCHIDLFLLVRLVVLTAPWWGKGKQTSHMEKEPQAITLSKRTSSLSNAKLAHHIDCLSHLHLV